MNATANVVPIRPAADHAAAFALSALMRFPELLAEGAIEPGDFDSARDRSLAQAIATVSPDIRTPEGSIPLLEAAARAGLEPSQISDLVRCKVYTREQADRWIRVVRQRAQSANLRQELREILALPEDPERPVEAVLSRLGDLRESYGAATAAAEVITLEELTLRYLATEEAATLEGRARSVCQSGYPILDRRCQWGYPGELSVLVGAGGDGKSTMALDMARRESCRGRHVLMFSGEMTGEQLGAKMAYAAAREDPKEGDIASVFLLRAAAERMKESGEGARVHVDLRFRTTPGQALASIRRVAATCGGDLGLVIYDHLRHFDVDALLRSRGSDGETAALSRASAEAKGLAKAAGVHVLMLAHTNRKTEGASEPTAAMVRGSEEIGQNADTLAMTWRPGGAKMKLYVLKSRRTGFRGSAEMDYDPRRQTFLEVMPC